MTTLNSDDSPLQPPEDSPGGSNSNTSSEPPRRFSQSLVDRLRGLSEELTRQQDLMARPAMWVNSTTGGPIPEYSTGDTTNTTSSYVYSQKLRSEEMYREFRLAMDQAAEYHGVTRVKLPTKPEKTPEPAENEWGEVCP